MDIRQHYDLRIDQTTLRLVAELDQFKGAWKALGRLAPERLATLRHIATIASVGSSTRIEGAALSDPQVEALLSGLASASFTSRDEAEVAGYAKAMQLVCDQYEAIALTENHLHQLHQILLQHSPKDERHRGQYKTHPNHVEAFDEQGRSLGVVFETTSAFDTPRLTRELLQRTNAALDGNLAHPIVVIAMFVVEFLAIHPYQDGNGRLSRILTTLLLLRSGYLYVPFSSLEQVIEHHKDGYYRALRATQATLRTEAPDWMPWIAFFLQALYQQKEALARRLQDDERIAAAVVSDQALAVLEQVRQRHRASVGELVQLTGGNRNTIKAHCRKLVALGFLELRGRGRGAHYVVAASQRS